ncbi:hypothetical protein [Paenibacillus marinisediminis]
MYIKKYMYQIDLNKMEEYRRVLAEAHEIYKRYTDYTIMVMESKERPGIIEEIQIYQSEQEYQNSQQLINMEPDIQKLYEAFTSILHRDHSLIEEEAYSDIMTSIT